MHTVAAEVKKKDDDEKKGVGGGGGDGKKVPKEKKRQSKVDELLAQHKSDPQFVEFMKTHAKGKGIWDDDWKVDEIEPVKGAAEQPDEEHEENEETAAQNEDEPAVKLADLEISDADYMKSLQNKDDKLAATKKVKKIKSDKDVVVQPLPLVDLLTIKIRNIPFKTKRQDVLNFFKPLKPYSIRLPTKVRGICYVGFKTEADFKKGMLKNRSFWSEFKFLSYYLNY